MSGTNTHAPIRALAAQLLMPALDVGKYHAEEEYRNEMQSLVRDTGVGGVIIFNGTIASTRSAVDALQAMAPRPLLVACDLEPGLRNRLADATAFPHAMAISRGDLRTCSDVAFAIAQEARAAGITINFAPVCDVNSNPRNPIINTRAFGEEPATVTAFAQAFIEGSHRGGVAAVVKHFPGHGDTAVDSHLALAVIDAAMDRLERVELSPFRSTMGHGADGVMVAHILATAIDAALPASLSDAWISGIIRRNMGYNGLVFTDALMMHAIATNYTVEDAAALAVNAGCDVLVMPVDVGRSIDGIVSAVERDPQLYDKIVAAIGRIDTARLPRELHLTIEQESAALLCSRVAERALTVKGDATQLPLTGDCAVVLLGGSQDDSDIAFTRDLLGQFSLSSGALLDLEVNGVNTLKNKYEKIYCLMFSGVVSFQGHLGETEKYQKVVAECSHRANATIGISVGNPYIWSDLSGFTCSVDTYSNSRASLIAALDRLMMRTESAHS